MTPKKKIWTSPVVTAADRMKNAKDGSGNGIPKGPTPGEFQFDGSGS